MLYHYLDHKRKESSAQLHATYLVSGKFVDNGQTVRKRINNICFIVRGIFLYAKIYFVLLSLCFLLESQGVSCQRGSAGRFVYVSQITSA